MPDQYDNTNSGVLYKNDRKEKQNQPDYKGSVESQCDHCGKNTMFWLSAWLKTAGHAARNPGSKFFSLALTGKDDEQAPPPSTSDSKDEEFDDIPF
jgi:hypothetical protein